jgi:hypothetical protein
MGLLSFLEGYCTLPIAMYVVTAGVCLVSGFGIAWVAAWALADRRLRDARDGWYARTKALGGMGRMVATAYMGRPTDIETAFRRAKQDILRYPVDPVTRSG